MRPPTLAASIGGRSTDPKLRKAAINRTPAERVRIIEYNWRGILNIIIPSTIHPIDDCVGVDLTNVRNPTRRSNPVTWPPSTLTYLMEFSAHSKGDAEKAVMTIEDAVKLRCTSTAPGLESRYHIQGNDIEAGCKKYNADLEGKKDEGYQLAMKRLAERKKKERDKAKEAAKLKTRQKALAKAAKQKAKNQE